jgi:hypothetical protein
VLVLLLPTTQLLVLLLLLPTTQLLVLLLLLLFLLPVVLVLAAVALRCELPSKTARCPTPSAYLKRRQPRGIYALVCRSFWDWAAAAFRRTWRTPCCCCPS